jgi:phenylalanyl-tRNA synthetase beta chain
LANPIASQMSVMRSTLIGGLVNVLATNRKRQTERVRIFEVGRCFIRSHAGEAVAGFAQPLRLAGLAAGPAAPEQWGLPTRLVDFYDVKADVEAFCAPRSVAFAKVEHPALHPGRSAEVLLDGRSLGVLGELHPRWVQKYELGTAPVVFELALSALLETPFSSYVPVSRFPAVTRDLALIVSQTQAAGELLDVLRKAAPEIVQEITLFDVYQGQNLGESKKSLAFHIVMQDTQRTLEEAEVDSVVALLLEVARDKFGASLR